MQKRNGRKQNDARGSCSVNKGEERRHLVEEQEDGKVDDDGTTKPEGPKINDDLETGIIHKDVQM